MMPRAPNLRFPNWILTMKRDELVEKILDIKRENGWT